MCIISTVWENPLKLCINPKVWRGKGGGHLEAGCKHKTPKAPIVAQPG